MFFISILISIVTLKNECIYLQNEIYHLESIHSTHASRIRVLNGNVNNLSRQDRIEEIAQMLSGAKITKAALDNATELLG